MTAEPDIQETASPVELGADLLMLMEHAVGKDGYRNYFAADSRSSDSWRWELLVGLKLAVLGYQVAEGLRCYHVSVPGMAMLRALHPRRYKAELKGVPLSSSQE